MNPENKVALITGGAHRVGGHITLALAEAGADVIIHYNNSADAASKTAESARGMGVRAYTYSADLSNLDELEALFSWVETTTSGIDILINSAAIMERISYLDVTEHDWAHTINVNLRAPFFCIQKSIPLMRNRGAGVIINISDIAGRQPWPRFPVHSISKTGIEMLTALAALQFGPEIRVNAIAPGPVLKPPSMSESGWATLGAALPLQHTGSAEDVARAVLFLIHSEFITGETIAVDGGNQWVT
jgi:NAD(P)-dependent dehydrogenase (short-subunit alcohol dehydrogenase family)